MIHPLDSHSSLNAKECFDEKFFIKANKINKHCLNGVSSFAYFQVHFHLLDLKARYRFEPYQRRLIRFIALGRCPSKLISKWAIGLLNKQSPCQYYYPPRWQDLKKLGIRAREADIFITPETVTNALVEFLATGEGIFSRPHLIELLPTLFTYADDGEEALCDSQIIEHLVSLHGEKEQASVLMVSLPGYLGRPKEIDESQRARMEWCFDTAYYATNYGHLYSWGEEESEEDDEDDGKLFEAYISEGRSKGHAPCEFFDYDYYIGKYWKSIASEEDAYHYYLTKGWNLGHDPSPRFSHEFLKKLASSLDSEDIFSPLERIIRSHYSASVMLSDMAECLEPTKSNYYTNCELNPTGKPQVLCLLDSAPAVHAFYLTQYHPVRENDTNWGKNFTEWTNTSKALPYFLGHHQPKLPLEGFYDLRIVDNLCYQANIADEFGIGAFCFYF